MAGSVHFMRYELTFFLIADVTRRAHAGTSRGIPQIKHAGLRLFFMTWKRPPRFTLAFERAKVIADPLFVCTVADYAANTFIWVETWIALNVTSRIDSMTRNATRFRFGNILSKQIRHLCRELLSGRRWLSSIGFVQH
jgi:hypothetical protein